MATSGRSSSTTSTSTALDPEVTAAVDDVLVAETFLSFGRTRFPEAPTRLPPHRSIRSAAGS